MSDTSQVMVAHEAAVKKVLLCCVSVESRGVAYFVRQNGLIRTFHPNRVDPRLLVGETPPTVRDKLSLQSALRKPGLYLVTLEAAEAVFDNPEFGHPED